LDLREGTYERKRRELTGIQVKSIRRGFKEQIKPQGSRKGSGRGRKGLKNHRLCGDTSILIEDTNTREGKLRGGLSFYKDEPFNSTDRKKNKVVRRT